MAKHFGKRQMVVNRVQVEEFPSDVDEDTQLTPEELAERANRQTIADAIDYVDEHLPEVLGILPSTPTGNPEPRTAQVTYLGKSPAKAQKATAPKPPKPPCMNCGEELAEASRGLGLKCYNLARRLVKQEKITWDELVKAGKCLPAKEGFSFQATEETRAREASLLSARQS